MRTPRWFFRRAAVAASSAGPSAVAARLACAGLMLAGALAGACQAQRDAGAPPSPVTLRVGVAQPPDGGSDTSLASVAALLGHASLVAIGRDGRVGPGLVEAWDVTSDGLRWRFHLRPNLTFHDGSAVTATEVASIVDASRAPGPMGVSPGLRDIVKVETTGPRTFALTLAAPSSMLLEGLALVRVSGGPNFDQEAGPFMVDTRDEGRLELRAFAGYHRGHPSIDRVVLLSFPTPRAAWSAMLRSEIDFLYEATPDAAAFLAAGTNAREFSFLRPYAYLVGFNLAHPPFADRRVRQALNVAIDRALVIDRALGGRGEAASSHIWPRHWAMAGRARRPPVHEPALAVALLDRAGHPPTRLTGTDMRPPGRLRFTCLIPADYPLYERLALVVQKQLADIGVDMIVEPVARAALARRLATGQFEAYLLDIASGHGFTWPYWFWHSPEADGAVPIRSSYRGADASLDRLRRARGDEEVQRALVEVDRALGDDPPGIFLCWSRITRAVDRRFVVAGDGDRDIVSNVALWRVAPQETAAR